MIRTEREYEEARLRLQEARGIAEKQRASLEASGLSAEHVDLALSPLLAFQDQLQGEVAWYEQARQGEVRPVPRLTDIGLVLIGLRLARGLTQRQLAERLGVNEAQISKDERNDYHGITRRARTAYPRRLERIGHGNGGPPCAEKRRQISSRRGDHRATRRSRQASRPVCVTSAPGQ